MQNTGKRTKKAYICVIEGRNEVIDLVNDVNEKSTRKGANFGAKMIPMSPKLLSEYNARTRFGGMEGLAPNSYQSGHPTMVVLLVKLHDRTLRGRVAFKVSHARPQVNVF